MKSLFEQKGGTYRQEGDYLIPNIEIPESKPVGKYGRMHGKFIKENYRYIYSTKLLDGTWSEYLYNVDIKAKNEVERLISLLADKQGITEQLKAENQLKWVGLMNNIKAQAEEIIYKDIIYVREAL